MGKGNSIIKGMIGYYGFISVVGVWIVEYVRWESLGMGGKYEIRVRG